MTEKDRVRLLQIRGHAATLNVLLSKYSYVLAGAKRFGGYKREAALVGASAERINQALAQLLP